MFFFWFVLHVLFLFVRLFVFYSLINTCYTGLDNIPNTPSISIYCVHSMADMALGPIEVQLNMICLSNVRYVQMHFLTFLACS